MAQCTRLCCRSLLYQQSAGRWSYARCMSPLPRLQQLQVTLQGLSCSATCVMPKANSTIAPGWRQAIIEDPLLRWWVLPKEMTSSCFPTSPTKTWLLQVLLLLEELHLMGGWGPHDGVLGQRLMKKAYLHHYSCHMLPIILKRYLASTICWDLDSNFPSSAPTQFGKLHNFWKTSAMALHSFVPGNGMHSPTKHDQSASHTPLSQCPSQMRMQPCSWMKLFCNVIGSCS